MDGYTIPIMVALGALALSAMCCWLVSLDGKLTRAMDQIKLLQYRQEVHWKLIFNRPLDGGQVRENDQMEQESHEVDREMECARHAEEARRQEEML